MVDRQDIDWHTLILAIVLIKVKILPWTEASVPAQNELPPISPKTVFIFPRKAFNGLYYFHVTFAVDDIGFTSG